MTYTQRFKKGKKNDSYERKQVITVEAHCFFGDEAKLVAA